MVTIPPLISTFFRSYKKKFVGFFVIAWRISRFSWFLMKIVFFPDSLTNFSLFFLFLDKISFLLWPFNEIRKFPWVFDQIRVFQFFGLIIDFLCESLTKLILFRDNYWNSKYFTVKLFYIQIFGLMAIFLLIFISECSKILENSEQITWKFVNFFPSNSWRSLS